MRFALIYMTDQASHSNMSCCAVMCCALCNGCAVLCCAVLCRSVLSPVLSSHVEQLTVALCTVVDDLHASETSATSHTAIGTACTARVSACLPVCALVSLCCAVLTHLY